ncbi:MAG: flagellar basal body-associated FliL family protein [Deltaproteobacteria bacterium]|nr:flagellar basal body-associated FliL family protein [Deltaproteobacteria bacterium]
MPDEHTGKEQAGKEEAPREKQGRSPLKLVLFIAVPLLVLGGGGVFAWKTFFSGQRAEGARVAVEKTSAEGKSEHKGGHKAEAKADSKGPAMTYPLDTFIVNLADTVAARYLKVTMELEVTGGKEAGPEQLKPKVPLMRDAVLLLLTSKTFDEVQSVEGKLKLREEIVSKLNATLPAPMIRRVYFTEFVIQ